MTSQLYQGLKVFQKKHKAAAKEQSKSSAACYVNVSRNFYTNHSSHYRWGLILGFRNVLEGVQIQALGQKWLME